MLDKADREAAIAKIAAGMLEEHPEFTDAFWDASTDDLRRFEKFTKESEARQFMEQYALKHASRVFDQMMEREFQ
jgi:hypothetical protein